MSNPYEKYDIDPREGPEAITARLRELAADADGDERDELRAVWERLTMHPQTRLEAALEAFPETRTKLQRPRPSANEARQYDPQVTIRDLALLPSVAAALGAGDDDKPTILPALLEDPNLDETQ